ncbi:hypothetical protein RhiirA4_471404 [Rhizophagus irregularis]|uniref:Uncharacterized protein n=1 Tax=Rhizophagus irregularis TaxID=588596 RepID=A0A2I1H383_9GLOM|nr:hypothetical protein RhiirA4_471404 [Rhizophagus irregularis]
MLNKKETEVTDKERKEVDVTVKERIISEKNEGIKIITGKVTGTESSNNKKRSATQTIQMEDSVKESKDINGNAQETKGKSKEVFDNKELNENNKRITVYQGSSEKILQ